MLNLASCRRRSIHRCRPANGVQPGAGLGCGSLQSRVRSGRQRRTATSHTSGKWLSLASISTTSQSSTGSWRSNSDARTTASIGRTGARSGSISASSATVPTGRSSASASTGSRTFDVDDPELARHLDRGRVRGSPPRTASGECCRDHHRGPAAVGRPQHGQPAVVLRRGRLPERRCRRRHSTSGSHASRLATRWLISRSATRCMSSSATTRRTVTCATTRTSLGRPWNWCWFGKAATAVGELGEARFAYEHAIELSADADETDAPELFPELGSGNPRPRAALATGYFGGIAPEPREPTPTDHVLGERFERALQFAARDPSHPGAQGQRHPVCRPSARRLLAGDRGQWQRGRGDRRAAARRRRGPGWSEGA